MKLASFLLLGTLLMACGESAVSPPAVAVTSSAPARAQAPVAKVAEKEARATPVTTAAPSFVFQDPDFPEDASKKLQLDAPRDAKAEKSNDGQEILAGPHFHLWIGPGWESNLGHDDRKSGYGLTDLTWVKREKTEIIYHATSRRKTAWFAEMLVDVPSLQEGESAEPYKCEVKQSIVDPESFTKEDADAMLAACRSLRHPK